MALHTDSDLSFKAKHELVLPTWWAPSRDRRRAVLGQADRQLRTGQHRSSRRTLVAGCAGDLDQIASRHMTSKPSQHLSGTEDRSHALACACDGEAVAVGVRLSAQAVIGLSVSPHNLTQSR